MTLKHFVQTSCIVLSFSLLSVAQMPHTDRGWPTTRRVVGGI